VGLCRPVFKIMIRLRLRLRNKNGVYDTIRHTIRLTGTELNQSAPLPGIYRLFFILILSAGLYLRLARLDGFIHFQGDQGEFYLAVMRWIQEGQWPLVGQHRSITGDYTIGPGWFYTIMPALVMGHFHPAAGVFVNTFFGFLAMLIAFAWMRRTSGNDMAAIVITLIMACSAILIEQDRLLWSPFLFHFATLAIALLISKFGDHPVRCLSLYLMFCMILPHWHTTGWIVIAISVLFMLRLIALNLQKLGAKSWRRNRIWILLPAMWFLLLYLPPLVYELRPGGGNLANYIVNTLKATPSSEHSLALRFTYIANVTSYHVLHQAFNWKLENIDWFRWIFTVLMIASVVAGWVICRRRKSGIDLSLGFMVTLFFTFILIYMLRAEYFDDYYMMASLLIPIHLVVWSGGVLLSDPESGRGESRSPGRARISGGIVLGVMVFLSVVQWPVAWAVHRRDPAAYHESLELTETISRMAGDEPFSIALLEDFNYRTHYHVLLKRLGREPMNRDFKRKSILMHEFGKQAFIMIKGNSAEYPTAIVDINPAYVTEKEIGQSRLLVIPRQAVEDGATGLLVETRPELKKNRVMSFKETAAGGPVDFHVP
jgi:hypothetical protein